MNKEYQITYNGETIPYELTKSKIKNMYIYIKNGKVTKYVILHEMCHLKYMNHSKEFWTLVETYMPEYQKYKNMLRYK